MRLHENWNEINIYFKIIIENNKLIQIFYFHKNNMRQLWLVNTQIFYEYTNLLLFLKWPIKAMLHKSDAALYVWSRWKSQQIHMSLKYDNNNDTLLISILWVKNNKC